jgi:hypothetical protein
VAVRELGNAYRGKAQGTTKHGSCSSGDADEGQGFDEFMNLVIDDAVEVTLANPKKETGEERRNIGQSRNSVSLCSLIKYRPNPPQRRQHLPDPAAAISVGRRRAEIEICRVTFAIPEKLKADLSWNAI